MVFVEHGSTISTCASVSGCLLVMSLIFYIGLHYISCLARICCRFSLKILFGIHRAYSYHLWRLSSFDINIVILLNSQSFVFKLYMFDFHNVTQAAITVPCFVNPS